MDYLGTAMATSAEVHATVEQVSRPRSQQFHIPCIGLHFYVVLTHIHSLNNPTGRKY
jgi:hypothetical protein